MTDEPSGWRPLSRPDRASPGSVPQLSAFTRLARVQAVHTAGDALVALALVDSVFFSVDPSEARWRVVLYLFITAAPFAVVAPLVGPAIDRLPGGQRLVAIGSMGLRTLAALLMISQYDTLLLFPLAFLQLVASKSYGVARAALVPAVVHDDAELIEANSKLGIISGAMGFLAIIPGLMLRLLGSGAVVAGAAVTFAVGITLALQIPRVQVAAAPATEEERVELRSAGIVLGASAVAVLRFSVGFLLFLVAFAFRDDGAGAIWYGLAVGGYGLGNVAGTAIAPTVRRVIARDEQALLGALVAATLTSLAAWVYGGRVAAVALATFIGIATAVGKLSFDSIVQRDAPEANRGRSFARFETKFQLAWVVGSLGAVGIPFPAWGGYLLLAAVSGFAAVTYFVGQQTLRVRGRMPTTLRQRIAAEVRRRRALRGEPPAGHPFPPPAPEARHVDGPLGESVTGPMPDPMDGPIEPARPLLRRFPKPRLPKR